MELLVPLDSRDSRPLYEQICQFIKEEIRKGDLKPLKKLPSSRALAKSLKVSRSTTQLAYEQLVAEGYLEALPRRGYFVAGLDGIFPPVMEKRETRPETPVLQVSDGSGTAAARLAGEGKNGQERKAEPWKVDFSPRGIDLERFPFSTWRRISRAVLKEEDAEMFLRGDPQGELALREAVRDYLHTARGVNCTASQIIVGAGNEYLLILLSQLLGRETGIAMENPTYKQAYRVFQGMGHPVFPVEMDEGGLRVRELERLPVSAAYVMPSHQFPTGIVMPVKRRQELLSWAVREPDRYLIEDDYDSEFRYRGKPIPALQGMDQNGRVIYMGTFSRAIAPAIRVGYLVLPPALLEQYEKKARFYSSTVSRVDQRILASFLVGGYFERHLNRMREIYKGKHDLLLSALKPLEKEFEIRGEFAGLHMLVTCRSDRTEREMVEMAAASGIRVYGLSSFYIGEEKPESRTVILGYASLTEEKIREGAGVLAEVFENSVNREKA